MTEKSCSFQELLGNYTHTAIEGDIFKGLKIEGDERSQIGGVLMGDASQSLFHGPAKVVQSRMGAAVEVASFGEIQEPLNLSQNGEVPFWTGPCKLLGIGFDPLPKQAFE